MSIQTRIPEPTDIEEVTTKNYLYRVIQSLRAAFSDIAREIDQTRAKTPVSSGITSDTTVGNFGGVFLIDASGGELTITLPPVGKNLVGFIYFIKKTDTGSNVDIVTADSATIDGASSVTLTTQYEVSQVVTDGTNWFTL